MRAVLLTVGDEILLGQIVDTNAAWLGEQLALVGVDVRRSETVGDEVPAIKAALERAFSDGAELVIVTGGLGPTSDDLTRPAVAEFFDRVLYRDADLMSGLEARYASRGRVLPPSGGLMADVPEGFEVMPNPRGTAPGLWGERTVDGRTQRIVLMPGVPHEMEAISEQSLLPRLLGLHPGAVRHRTLLTVGRGETEIAERVERHPELFGKGLAVAYLPSLGHVRVRITSRGSDPVEAQARLDRATDELRVELGDLIYGEERDSLEHVLQIALRERGQTLALAESCTGGAIASRITEVPGASQAFVGGVVAYDNEIKERILMVHSDVLAVHGAVSEQAARAMAEGVVKLLRGTVGLSVTGIAGPTGGTPDKPVGTVWIACATSVGTTARLLQLTTDRHVNIGLTVTYALDLARRTILAHFDPV